MNILMICGHGDQRMIKESLALKRKGHGVSLLTQSTNSYMDYFDEVIFFGSTKKLECHLSRLEADIYHIHCKPSSIPYTCIKKLIERKKKFVYDVHDLDLVRFERTNAEEIFALVNSPYLIFPDEAVRDKTFELILGSLSEKPESLVLLPYFSLVDMVYPLIQPNPSVAEEVSKKIVYEGNIINPAIENIKLFPYYDLRFTSFVLSSYDFEFHIYPVGIPFDQARQFYDTSGAILHHPVEYPSLVREMSQFGWGFFGAFGRSTQQDCTFANKVFDYICAGIPVVVLNAKRMGDWLEETGFGFSIRVVEDYEKMKDRNLRAEYQQRVLG